MVCCAKNEAVKFCKPLVESTVIGQKMSVNSDYNIFYDARLNSRPRTSINHTHEIIKTILAVAVVIGIIAFAFFSIRDFIRLEKLENNDFSIIKTINT